MGVFDIGSDFGNLKTLAGGDVKHSKGVELHFTGGEAKLIEIVGFDSDAAAYPDEIRMALNGAVIGGLPKGPDGGWTDVYHLYLPDTMLNTGDNKLMISNKYNAAYNWGIKLNQVSSGDTPLGKGIPGAVKDYVDKVTYLVPGGTSLDLNFYDADFADEIQVFVDGADIGFASVTPDNGWGAIEIFPLSTAGMSVVEVDCTYNPPNTYKWGTQIALIP